MKWINTEDNLPVLNVLVIGYMPETKRIVMVSRGQADYGWLWYGCCDYSLKKKEVTYWMPLPEFPNQKENKK